MTLPLFALENEPRRSRRSIVKQLATLLGGMWAYRDYSWHCTDGLRWVARVGRFDEFECRCGPSEYWLYGDGAPRKLPICGRNELPK